MVCFLQAQSIMSQYDSMLKEIGSVREKITFDCLESDTDLAEDADVATSTSEKNGAVG